MNITLPSSPRRLQASPYDVWVHVGALKQEIHRLKHLEPVTLNTDIIARWRRQMVVKAEQRISELTRILGPTQ